MDRRTLGKTGLSVSILTFSGVMLDKVDDRKASELVAFSVDSDINYFDVAPSYGNAQYMLGPALMPYRKEIYLACKTGERDAKGTKTELLESLSALKTDYFDVYQFHGVDDMDEVEQIFAPGGAMETFAWALEEGLIRHIGFTSHNDAVSLEMLKRADFEVLLTPVNFTRRETLGASVEPLKVCVEKDVGVVAIMALAERVWREGEEVTYPRVWYRPIYDNPKLARIALNYTLSCEGVTTAPPPGDERMFRMTVEFIRSQGGRAVEPRSEDLAFMNEHIKRLGAADMKHWKDFD